MLSPRDIPLLLEREESPVQHRVPRQQEEGGVSGHLQPEQIQGEEMGSSECCETQETSGCLEEVRLMLGGIGGRRRRGQQRMRWLDGITDSMDVSLRKTGLEGIKLKSKQLLTKTKPDAL